jgi:hypothetical protein
MKQRTPQEKKKLSYERDRRNCYGESPHGARKSIPLRKALRNRANRHSQNQQLIITGLSVNEEMADQLESQMHHRAPINWKKFPDSPLKEVLTKKLEEREIMRTEGGRRALITYTTYSTPEEE